MDTYDAVAVWKRSPKGPKLNDEELAILRKIVAAGEAISNTEVRRLFQTLDSVKLHFETGLVVEFPPIASKVYMTDFRGGIIPDVYSGEVVSHLSNGTIAVKTEVSRGEFRIENWLAWHTEMPTV